MKSLLLLSLLYACQKDVALAFLAYPRPLRPTFLPYVEDTSLSAEKAASKERSGRKPSKVEDLDGPTPEMKQSYIEDADPVDVPELAEINKYDDLPTPIPHQPWRKGDTAGCDAPIAAEWRKEAEEIIQKAVSFVGGQVLDVTWYVTALVVTLDEEMMPPRDFLKARGPVIDIIEPSSPSFTDPNDPQPEDIWADEDGVLYQRKTEEEAAEADQRKKNMYANKDKDDPEDEPHISDQMSGDDIPLYVNEETRDDVALHVAEAEQERIEDMEKPMNVDTLMIDTAGLSTIAQAILDALGDREEELQILSRHELILTSPGPPDMLETQRQFDAYRGSGIIVETQDPFESNRTLKGKLVDRNAMDLLLSKKGRIVTVPLNFVKCVRLAHAKKEMVET